MAKVMFIDPPSGWMYGFPKIIPIEVLNGTEDEFYLWLLDNGYPADELSPEGKLYYCRYWESEE